MKKTLSLILSALLLLGALAGCGAQVEKDVDLNAFYQEITEKYELGSMMALEGDFLESAYPGLSQIPTVQFIAQTAMISAVVCEIVLLQCETPEDAAQAAQILETRVSTQAEGGAWYPASMAAWEEAEVITHGSYVALIAADQNQDALEADFNALFD